MKQAIALVWVLVLGVWGQLALAQDQVWLQVEAQPNLRKAEERARNYAAQFSNVAGFRLGSGWYAILIGPLEPVEAEGRLADLRGSGQIPGDSFVADNQTFRQQFWPVGTSGIAPQDPVGLDEPLPEPPGIEQGQIAALAEPVAETPAAEPPAPETLAQASRSEADLTDDQKEQLQAAMKWLGFYDASIDGDFGPGTRDAMAAWQSAKGYEVTGILTTAQRGVLAGDYKTDLASLGLEIVREPSAGIEISLPTALVAFDHYDPPFVHYKPVGDSGVSVLLISQAGDQNTLFGLYDIMQTLEIVPPTGDRNRDDASFTLSGQNADLQSYTYAALQGGLVKGFTLVWRPSDSARMARVLAAMKSSFAPFGDRAMDDGAGSPTTEQKRGMLGGLEVRRPAFSRSGFYIDANGTVLTTADAVKSCSRITLDGTSDATVTFTDTTLGLAVLKPGIPLSPRGYAEFQTATPRLQSEVAVAGYSYEDQLPLPTLTFGALEDLRGLNGEETLRRLALRVLAGDAGGPVIDSTGSVLGMLLPRSTDTGRVLPGDVNFATTAQSIAAALAGANIATSQSTRQGGMPAEDLTALATDMTVLVSCWN